MGGVQLALVAAVGGGCQSSVVCKPAIQLLDRDAQSGGQPGHDTLVVVEEREQALHRTVGKEVWERALEPVRSARHLVEVIEQGPSRLHDALDVQGHRSVPCMGRW